MWLVWFAKFEIHSDVLHWSNVFREFCLLTTATNSYILRPTSLSKKFREVEFIFDQVSRDPLETKAPWISVYGTATFRITKYIRNI
jgi:hypothetical protein